jgi:20S proteasome alpha/beta subunit
MTVIVAARCRDGAIMASDSQATEMATGVRWDVQKVFRLTDRAVWGASGMTNITDDVRATLEDVADMLVRTPRLDNALRKLVGPVVKGHYDTWNEVPGQSNNSPATAFMACGLTAASEPFILDIDQNNNCGFLDRDWHAIGSAGGFAQMAGALLSHFGLRNLSVDYGTVIVYRALDAVIHTSHFGVGGEPQLWVVTEAGCHQLTTAETQALERLVAGWKEIERDALDRAMGQPGMEEAPPPPELS